MHRENVENGSVADVRFGSKADIMEFLRDDCLVPSTDSGMLSGCSKFCGELERH
jgi:hypothetical protein